MPSADLPIRIRSGVLDIWKFAREGGKMYFPAGLGANSQVSLERNNLTVVQEEVWRPLLEDDVFLSLGGKFQDSSMMCMHTLTHGVGGFNLSLHPNP